MQPAELKDHLTEKLGPRVTDAKVAYGQLTVTVEPDALPDAARLCKEDPALGFDFFDFMAGVDEREAGFSVVTHLYSVQHRHHIRLRALAPGGREAPRLPTLTGVYRGADWHEREAYDMFGIEFEGHPGLLPRILTVENFEGFPLRKDFLLTSREVKPWPGAKEPGESDATPAGQAVPGTTGDTPITTEDRAAAAKSKAERAKAKAAAMRKQKAAERAGKAPEQPPEDDPHGAARIAGTAIAKDAAAGAVQGDVAAGAPGDLPGVDEPIDDPAAEGAAGEGAPATERGTPGIEKEGRHR
jgi:NADH-quinone oxidoreductase subunit C